MAIWVQYFGENKNGYQPAAILELWDKQVRTASLDLSFLADSLQRSDLLNSFSSSYDGSKWIAKEDTFEGRPLLRMTYPLYKNDDWDGLKFIFYSDIILFLGPFAHFSSPRSISSDPYLSENYGRIMRCVFKIFGSRYAFFCDEWTFDDDEYAYTFGRIQSYFGNIRPTDYWQLIALG